MGVTRELFLLPSQRKRKQETNAKGDRKGWGMGSMAGSQSRARTMAVTFKLLITQLPKQHTTFLIKPNRHKIEREANGWVALKVSGNEWDLLAVFDAHLFKWIITFVLCPCLFFMSECGVWHVAKFVATTYPPNQHLYWRFWRGKTAQRFNSASEPSKPSRNFHSFHRKLSKVCFFC